MNSILADPESFEGEHSTAKEQVGRTNQDPNEYKIEDLDEYDSGYLREIVKYLHDENERLRKKLKLDA